MNDYQLFCITIIVIALMRIAGMTRAAAQIALSLPDRSAAAENRRNQLALFCVRQVGLFGLDVEKSFRRLLA